jgi:NAD(P)-dependent dehydrogenase (short-subunit alcohol dehydrogenase family)
VKNPAVTSTWRGHKDPSRHKIVAITGASAGVGRATVRRFAKSAARIALMGRGRDGLEAAREDVERAGGQALVLPMDVADAAAVEAAAARIEAELGPIDIWINNAMVSVFSPIHEMTAEEFRRVTEVTYLGCVHGTLAALKRMRPRNRGVIVQVGSALAYRAIPLQSAYCAAKHAARGFTDSLRCELLHEKSNVRVTMVHLPAVNTPQFRWVKSRLPHKAQPVPPIFQPEVAADAIYFAAHHSRREFYVGLPTVKAIVANKFAPGLLDRFLGRNGFASQQHDGLEDPNRANNLWEPLAGDHGAHGVFDQRAKSWSPQFWADKHRGWLSLAIAALALIGVAAGARRRLR